MKNESKCKNCSAPGKSKIRKPKQFNFERNWEKKIAPLLDDPDVVQALDLGLRFYQSEFYEEAPANLRGYPLSPERRAARESLWWYQSWENSHWLAPFCWALGKKLYPQLKWGFASSSFHTVAIGWSEDWEKPERVLDILEFQSWSGQYSLDVVKEEDGKFYDSLTQYFSSFYSNSEELYRDLEAKKNVMALSRGTRDSN